MSEQPWFRIGHTTYVEKRSGCTTIIFEYQVPAAVDVRGGAPGTRETTLLEPGNIGLLDAIVLSGGSAFGLQASDGVMRYLAQKDRGFKTRAGNVPLVTSAIIFDLGVGEAYHPTSDDGFAAAAAATFDNLTRGAIGAGAGATVAKLSGSSTPSGIGTARIAIVGYTITAIVVLNAVGDIRDAESGAWLARTTGPACRESAVSGPPDVHPLENTTVGAVLIDGPMDRKSLSRVCISAQAGLVRCTIPAHTVLDGDTFFAAASKTGTPTITQTLAVTAATEIAVERAVASIFNQQV
jgi:L-aminopeptidase/D-esterase-like protein